MKPSAGGSSNYVADWVMDVLNDLIGRWTRTSGGDHDRSTMQTAAEKALIDEIFQKGEKFNVQQGALVPITPDGAVRALVGGRNYAENQFNRAVAAKRQPGSAFKPFVYLTALEHGLTPGHRARGPADRASKAGSRELRPRIFRTGHARQALAIRSTRCRCGSPWNSARPRDTTAHRLGISSKLEPNASIALGTSEVSPLELVSAYVPFANGGLAITPHVVMRVRSGTRVLYVRQDRPLGRVIDPTYVAMMDSMMHETLASGTARHADLPGWMAAGKTGTSQDFRDAWFIGFTTHMVTGVWLGNDDSSPTKKLTGGSLPVEIWSRFMKVAHQRVAVAALPGVGSSGLFGNLLGGGNFDGESVGAAAGAPPRPTAGLMRAPRPRARRNAVAWMPGWSTCSADIDLALRMSFSENR